jgi:isopentenyl diphosphate isomerase/L-lactate dehydrogenase-like FMN-dependent dehydrogenase
MADATLGAWNIADLRDLAKKRLPKGLFEFMDRGCEDEVSLRNNRAVFERIRLKPRVLNDVSKVDAGVDFFGHRIRLPVFCAPVGSLESRATSTAPRSASCCSRARTRCRSTKCSVARLVSTPNNRSIAGSAKNPGSCSSGLKSRPMVTSCAAGLYDLSTNIGN